MNTRRKRFDYVQEWLNKQQLVVVGYADPVKGINFIHLLACWLDCHLDGKSFEDYYPHAADSFQIRVLNGEDAPLLQEILPEFDGCFHIKVWCFGEEMEV